MASLSSLGMLLGFARLLLSDGHYGGSRLQRKLLVLRPWTMLLLSHAANIP